MKTLDASLMVQFLDCLNTAIQRLDAVPPAVANAHKLPSAAGGLIFVRGELLRLAVADVAVVARPAEAPVVEARRAA